MGEMSEKLLPCPFCGSPYQGHFTVPGGAVFHYHVPEEHKPGCPMRRNGTYYASEQDAIDAWNTRQPPAPAQVSDEMVENGARALCLVQSRHDKDGVVTYETLPNDIKELWRDDARAALEAALQTGVPSGYALVPIKPNAAIATAIGDVLDKQDADSGAVCWYTVGEEAWRAGVKAGSLAAAPAPGEGMCACGAMTAQACNDLPSLRHCQGAQTIGEGR